MEHMTRRTAMAMGALPVLGAAAAYAGGEQWLRGLGLAPSPPSQRRRFAYPCLDWSERRDHLAGQLADELCAHLVGRGWLRREDGRALALTRSGERELLPRLPIAPP